MSQPSEKPLQENSTSSQTEDWLKEFISLADKDGYYCLVQRDKSLYRSIYVWLCLPPLSIHKTPRQTPFTFRISDHPPSPYKLESIIGSVHPGQEDVRKEWNKAKVKIREHREAKKKEVQSFSREYSEIARHITKRRKR